MRGTMFDGPTEWLSLLLPSGKNLMANVSWLMSNYKCQYGVGCPGLQNRAQNRWYVGCCERGVTFIDDDDYNNVLNSVGQLTAEDADNIDHIQNVGWSRSVNGKPYSTRKLDDKCIFANSPDGPAGKAGCAFHHLAARTGKHHSDTKPDICWAMPIQYNERLPLTDDGPEQVVLSPVTADTWGGRDKELDGDEYMGYWCMDVPDSYNGEKPFYRTNEIELRKIMGNEDFEFLADILDDELSPYPMPAEIRNSGFPMLPLLIEGAKDRGLPVCCDNHPEGIADFRG
jgi:hypothetical protein